MGIFGQKPYHSASEDIFMNKNSFKLLQEEDEQQFAQHASDVQRKVEGTLDVYRHIGQLVDVYVAKALTLFGTIFTEQAPAPGEAAAEEE